MFDMRRFCFENYVFDSRINLTVVQCTPSSTQLGFESMTSRSWQYILCPWEVCPNHSAIMDLPFKVKFSSPLLFLEFLPKYKTLGGDKLSMLAHTYPHKSLRKTKSDHMQSPGWQPTLCVAWCVIWWVASLEKYGHTWHWLSFIILRPGVIKQHKPNPTQP